MKVKNILIHKEDVKCEQVSLTSERWCRMPSARKLVNNLTLEKSILKLEQKNR